MLTVISLPGHSTEQAMLKLASWAQQAARVAVALLDWWSVEAHTSAESPRLGIQYTLRLCLTLASTQFARHHP
eukprot:CAMPEP_0172776954 /NCGR_PEP_ID=MMETSP1074-20121228/200891_1 /TAXON_ID=2916 /ORGANISM="Ceratium fusus, Strain PA161109" /LENGTH=72 /DNA_ID=CAMNT_0013613823 /DNA_START=202 /DNA_END=420 /DNA_ORIENTATION=+